MADNEKQYVDLLHTMVESVVKTVIGPQGQTIVDRVMPDIEARIKEQYGYLPEVHEIVSLKGKNKVIGDTHEEFDTILQMVQMNIPVYLIGKAGCGKNVICKQVAEGLGLDFYFTNAVTQEYKLTGFIDANGNYHETQFYKAFTKGGLFFLDEMDASIPEVLIILNAAIANRYFDFPTGKVEAHPDFRVIAAGNTFGTGADNNYTGRYCLDRASLDRFAVVDVNYSTKIESAITDGNEDLMDFCHIVRIVAKKSGINCLFSYRTLERISLLEKIMPLSKVLKVSLIKELDSDSVNILNREVKGYDDMAYNKYAEALDDLANDREWTPKADSDNCFNF